MKIAETVGTTGVFEKKENQKIPLRRQVVMKKWWGVFQKEAIPATGTLRFGADTATL
ncbi:MAG: hypothetical protein P8Y00_04225 [Deltaproteobacteria bacterium]